MTQNDFLLVLSTCPERATGVALARSLLEAGHAACVNVVPGVHSLYVWQGALQADDEVLLLIKTTARQFPALREALVAQHPYELPEVIAIDIADGHHPYLQWLAEPRGAARANDPDGSPRDALLPPRRT